MAYRITYMGICKAGAFANAHDADKPHLSVGIQSYGSLNALIEKEAANMVEGCWIVDASQVDDDLAVREAVSGPMVQSGIEVDEGLGAFNYCTSETKAKRWEALGAKVWRHTTQAL